MRTLSKVGGGLWRAATGWRGPQEIRFSMGSALRLPLVSYASNGEPSGFSDLIAFDETEEGAGFEPEAAEFNNFLLFDFQYFG